MNSILRIVLEAGFVILIMTLLTLFLIRKQNFRWKYLRRDFRQGRDPGFAVL